MDPTVTTSAPENPAVSEAVVAIQEQVDKASGFFNNVKDYFIGKLPTLIIAAVILTIGVLLSKLLSRIIASAMSRSNVDKAAKNFLVSFIRIILYVVVIIMALSVLNVPMSSIITILGAAGLAASLALQNCLTNLCGGFIILFSKPFSAGDTVELDGTVGKVKVIGLLYTTIGTFDGKTVLFPNGKLTDTKLINYTDTPNRRVDLSFDISYSSDYSMARQLILTAVSENKMILSDPAPVVRMKSHKESSISIDVLLWVRNEDYNETRYAMTEAVKSLFDKYGIEIPFNQLDVHIVRPEE